MRRIHLQLIILLPLHPLALLGTVVQKNNETRTAILNSIVSSTLSSTRNDQDAAGQTRNASVGVQSIAQPIAWIITETVFCEHDTVCMASRLLRIPGRSISVKLHPQEVLAHGMRGIRLYACLHARDVAIQTWTGASVGVAAWDI